MIISNNLIGKLSKIANSLDIKGKYVAANDIDNLIKSIVAMEKGGMLVDSQWKQYKPVNKYQAVMNMHQASLEILNMSKRSFGDLNLMSKELLVSKHLPSNVVNNLQTNINYSIQAAKKLNATVRVLEKMLYKIIPSFT